MRFLLRVSFLLLLLTTAPAARADVIGVFADLTASYCQVTDTPGSKTLYVMHKYTLGSTGSRFRIELSDGFTGTLVSAPSPYSNVTGDPLTGVTINYDNTCITGSEEILELHFLFFGTSPECSWVRAAAHPLSADGQLDAYDCAFARVPAGWGGTHVQSNPNIWCPDRGGGPDAPYYCWPYTPPLPTASATWGAVKALYR